MAVLDLSGAVMDDMQREALAELLAQLGLDLATTKSVHIEWPRIVAEVKPTPHRAAQLLTWRLARP